MSIPYFPMYAQDWLSDPEVSALSYEEQGILFHLMCRMWQTSSCSLPDDDLKISRLMKLNHNKWQRIKASLSTVLTYSNGTFFSKRLMSEFQIATKLSGVNSKSAKKRWEVEGCKLLIDKEMVNADAFRAECHKDKDKDKDKDLKDIPSSGEEEHSEDDWISKKKRLLEGKRLETFKTFWDAFDYKKGRAEAIDAWLDIPQLNNGLVAKILVAAKVEAMNRAKIVQKGGTPKFAQGWLSARRWEDEHITPKIGGINNDFSESFLGNDKKTTGNIP
jgi:uncharacterized protein YdaU (DUF1376 family)